MTSGSTTERGLPAAIPETLDAGTLPEQIHDILEDAIIQGVFAPGERLHTDRLAARYGVSRIPVREALRSLHEAGWVDIRDHQMPFSSMDDNHPEAPGARRWET